MFVWKLETHSRYLIFQDASMVGHDKSDEIPAPTPAESNDSTDEVLFNPNFFTE